MVSSTTFTEEQLKLVEPREDQMFTREGFDRKNIRFELANADVIDLSDRFVDHGEQTYVNPSTTDMPHGPTGIGEAGGGGVDFIRVDGEAHPTYRFAQGFTLNAEDLDAGAVDVAEQRNKVLEMFDFLADSMFLKGIEDRDGTVKQPGVFSWLKSNISTERSLNADDFDGDSGDAEDYVSDNTQENIFKYDAYSEVSGRINDSGQWDLAIGRQKALAKLNKRAPSDGGTDPRDSYWDRIQTDNGIGEVGIQNRMLVPDTLTFSEAPPGQDPIQVDLTSELGPNELLVLPDMDQVRSKFWRLREMSSPEAFGPVEKEAGKSRTDYVWRYSHSFDPKGTHGTATDAVHLTNIDQLYV